MVPEWVTGALDLPTRPGTQAVCREGGYSQASAKGHLDAGIEKLSTGPGSRRARLSALCWVSPWGPLSIHQTCFTISSFFLLLLCALLFPHLENPSPSCLPKNSQHPGATPNMTCSVNNNQLSYSIYCNSLSELHKLTCLILSFDG